MVGEGRYVWLSVFCVYTGRAGWSQVRACNGLLCVASTATTVFLSLLLAACAPPSPHKSDAMPVRHAP